jgi:hypothetical protein
MEKQTKAQAGKVGGKNRAAKLSAKRRKEIATQGGKALWERIRAGTLKTAEEPT